MEPGLEGTRVVVEQHHAILADLARVALHYSRLGRHARVGAVTVQNDLFGRRRVRRLRLVVLLPILALGLQACGTRLPDSAFVNAQRGALAAKTADADQGGADLSSTGATAGDQGVAGGTANGVPG